MIALNPKALDIGVAQVLTIQLVPNRVNIGSLGKLHVHQRAPTEINPVNQTPVSYDRNDPNEGQSQRKTDEIPLYSHPVNLRFVKELHGLLSRHRSLRIDTAGAQQVPESSRCS